MLSPGASAAIFCPLLIASRRRSRRGIRRDDANFGFGTLAGVTGIRCRHLIGLDEAGR
jgi:hypothetical protein